MVIDDLLDGEPTPALVLVYPFVAGLRVRQQFRNLCVRICKATSNILLDIDLHRQNLASNAPELGLNQIELVTAATHYFGAQRIDYLQRVAADHLLRRLVLFHVFLVGDEAAALFRQCNHLYLVFKVFPVELQDGEEGFSLRHLLETFLELSEIGGSHDKQTI